MLGGHLIWYINTRPSTEIVTHYPSKKENMDLAFLRCTGDNPEQKSKRNVLGNMLALVCRSWHSALAPANCTPVVIRWVILNNAGMLAVGENAPAWWRWVAGREDVTNTGLAHLAARCHAITTLDLHH